MHAAPGGHRRCGRRSIVYLQKPMAATLHECRVITRGGGQGGRGDAARQSGPLQHRKPHGGASCSAAARSARSRKSSSGKTSRSTGGRKTPSCARRATRFRRASTGTCGWACASRGRTWTTPIIRRTWRAWFDFGVGEMGDMGCHHFDTTFDALKLTAPLRVRQTTPGSSGPLWGEKRIVEMIFPGSDITAGNTVQLTWHDGGMRAGSQQDHAAQGRERASRVGRRTGSASAAPSSRNTAAAGRSCCRRRISRRKISRAISSRRTTITTGWTRSSKAAKRATTSRTAAR